MSPEWGPDGEAVYLVTDDGTDTLYLARLDLETEQLELNPENRSKSA